MKNNLIVLNIENFPNHSRVSIANILDLTKIKLSSEELDFTIIESGVIKQLKMVSKSTIHF